MAVDINSVVQEVVIDDSKAVGPAQNITAAFSATADASDRLTASTTKQKSALDQLNGSTTQFAPAQSSAASALARWKAAADPMEGVQQKMTKAQGDWQRAIQQGLATQVEATASLALLKTRLLDAVDGTDKHAASTYQATLRMQEFTHVGRSMFDSMSAGASPMQALTRESGRLQIAFSSIGASSIAAVAGTAILAGGFAVIMASAIAASNQVRQFETAIQGMGSVAGISGNQAHDIATSVFQQTGDRAGANAGIQNILRSRTIQGPQINQIASMAPDLGAALGGGTADGFKQLTDAATQGYPAIKKLDDEMGFLTAAQLANIKTMSEQGNAVGAWGAAIDALRPRIDGLYQQSLSNVDKATVSFSVAWDGLMTALGKTDTIQGAIAALGGLSKAITYAQSPNGLEADIGPASNGSGAPTVADYQKQLDGLQSQTGGLEGAQLQRRLASQALQQKIAQMQGAQGSPGAPSIATPSVTYGEQYGPPAPPAPASTADEKSLKLVQDQTDANQKLAAAMNQVGVARELALAKIAAENDNVARNITGDAASINIKNQQAAVMIRLTGDIVAQNAQWALNSKQTTLVSAAYLKSEADGMEADARRQATLEALSKPIDVNTRTQQLLTDKIQATAQASAAAIPAMERQAQAQQAIADAAKNGYDAQHQAELQAQIDEATHAERVAADIAATQGQLAVEAQLREEIDRKTKAIQTSDTAQHSTQTTDALRQSQEQLSLTQAQYDLVGQLPVARDAEIARLQTIVQLQRQRIPLESQEGQEIVANAERMARLQAATQEIDSVTQRIGDDFSQSLIAGGVKGSDALKTIMQQTVAEIASALIFKPLIQPVVAAVVGSAYGVGGGGGLGSLLGGSGGIAGLFGSSSGGTTTVQQVVDSSGAVIGTTNNGSRQVVDSSGNVVGTVGSGGTVTSSSGDVLGTLQQGASYLSTANNLSKLGGGQGLFGNLFSGDGTFSGSSINDLFGGSGSSLFSGEGAFGAKAINQFGANTFGLADGTFSGAGGTLSGAGAQAAIGAGDIGGDALTASSGALGATTLSEAIPYVGAAITPIMDFASGNTAGGVGSLVGMGIGAAVGSIIPGIGTALGAVIGSTLGSFIGGMFGGKVSPPGSSATMGTDANGQLITSGLGHFGGPGDPGAGPARAITDAEAQQFGGFNSAYDLQFSGGGPGNPKVNYQGGNYTVTLGTGTQSYTNPTDALNALTAGNIATHTLQANAPGSIGIAENTVLATTSATTFADLASALNDAITAANHYDSVLSATGHTVSQLVGTYGSLNDQLTKDQQQAQQYGLNVDALTQAYTRQFNVNIQDQISAANDNVIAAKMQTDADAQARLDEANYLGGDTGSVNQLNAILQTQAGNQLLGGSVSDLLEQITNPLQFALDQEKETAAKRIEIAQQFGLDMAAVEKLNDAERNQILEQSGAQLKQWLDGQVLSTSSTLSPTQQAAAAMSQFNAAAAAVRGGDTTQLNSLTSLGDAVLSTNKAINASSSDYATAEAFVRATITDIGHSLGFPGFAGGTSSAPGGWSWVGEDGPEPMYVPQGATIVPNNAAMSLDGASTAATYHQTAALLAELRALRSEVAGVKSEQVRTTKWLQQNPAPKKRAA